MAMTTCCCGSDILEDFVTTSGFEGVEGQIFHLNIGCANPFHDEDQYPDEDAWVEVMSAGVSKGVVYSDGKGEFRIPLEHGEYDIVVYPSEAFIDESLRGVTISKGNGTRIRKSYQNQYWPHKLIVAFFGNTPIERANEIIRENGLGVHWASIGGSFHVFGVKVPAEIHVQQMQRTLQEDYKGEVDSAHVEGYTCAASN